MQLQVANNARYLFGTKVVLLYAVENALYLKLLYISGAMINMRYLLNNFDGTMMWQKCEVAMILMPHSCYIQGIIMVSGGYYIQGIIMASGVDILHDHK